MSHIWLSGELKNLASKNSGSSSASKANPTHNAIQARLGEFYLHQIVTDSSPIYGEGFRRGYAAVTQFGLSHTIQHLRFTGDFPWWFSQLTWTQSAASLWRWAWGLPHSLSMQPSKSGKTIPKFYCHLNFWLLKASFSLSCKHMVSNLLGQTAIQVYSVNKGYPLRLTDKPVSWRELHIELLYM